MRLASLYWLELNSFDVVGLMSELQYALNLILIQFRELCSADNDYIDAKGYDNCEFQRFDAANDWPSRCSLRFAISQRIASVYVSPLLRANLLPWLWLRLLPLCWSHTVNLLRISMI